MRLIPWILTVSGAMWVTGNAVVATVAIAAFRWQRDHADILSREGLGGALGAALGLWSTLVSLLLLAAMVALGWLAGTVWRTGKRSRAAMLIIAMALLWGVHAVNHQTVIEANQVTAGIRELRASDKPNDHEILLSLEQRFAELHHASEMWHGIETLAALVLVVCGSVVLLRQPRASALPTAA